MHIKEYFASMEAKPQNPQDMDFLFSSVFRSMLVGLSLTSIDVCVLVLIQI